MIKITSAQNEKVKKWRKLHTKKGRINSDSFLVEGYHLVEEARNSEWKIIEVIVSEKNHIPDWSQAYRVFQLSEHVFRQVCQTKNPQGIAAVIEMKSKKPSDAACVLMLDAIQDPGNLGTIIRTADACGFDSVCLGNDTVDPYNDKVIRSTQGSLFHIALEHVNLKEKIVALKEEGFSVWASALQHADNYQQTPIPEKIALIIGNEGAGIQPDLLKLADQIVKIPIYGKAESLNASVAAGILMYHVKNGQVSNHN
ncbi:RNA methyltransferase [Virgibacillus sp. 179-BFC.A HS]|uniref:RNA methyltransferase n=1 Tax=Tigheibacillus jepli TaxID=3035914 RepID=A0ABU5CGQ0_9BACI|nr:RNA methyltransferase [Virgibacillus sp. 179-BFC.A HS]MDY0405395.1 RNA methyltransferase [Virgibacillus sp. 179-BFC.A HS]